MLVAQLSFLRNEALLQMYANDTLLNGSQGVPVHPRFLCSLERLQLHTNGELFGLSCTEWFPSYDRDGKMVVDYEAVIRYFDLLIL